MEEMTEAEETAYRDEVAAEMWGDEQAQEQEVEVEAEQVQEAAPEVDPWSGVNPALKGAFDALQEKVASFDAMSQRLQSSEGRIGALQRELQQQRNAAQKAAEMVDTAPTQEQMAAASANQQKWADLKEDFPEWADALDMKTGELRGAVSKEIASLQSKIASMSDPTEAVGGKINEIVRTFETKLLTIKHPNWREINAAPEYAEWLRSQPQDVQWKAKNSEDALECIEILDQYTNARPTKTAADIAAERQARLESAGTTVRSGKRTVPIKSEDDMTPEEYRAHISKKIWSN